MGMRAEIQVQSAETENRSAWSLAYEEYACNPHPPACLRLTIFTARNGMTSYREQCRRCGRTARVFKKADLTAFQIAAAVPFDESIERERMTLIQERAKEIEQKRSEEWFRGYNEYLQSPAWKARRAAVLERDDWTCQGCRRNRATQVHHLTYAHVGNELLFELTSVCDDCHRKIHPDKF